MIRSEPSVNECPLNRDLKEFILYQKATEMNEIFEQLKFLKHVTDIGNPKVQECSFWGISGTLIMFLSDAVHFLAESVLGITVYFTIALFVIMFVDLVTGLMAAGKEHQKKTSKKGLRWVFKFGCYVLFVYVINALGVDSLRTGIESIAFIMEVIKYYVIFHIAAWELQSIDENMERNGYSFRIFKLFNNIYTYAMKLINDKIGLK